MGELQYSKYLRISQNCDEPIHRFRKSNKSKPRYLNTEIVECLRPRGELRSSQIKKSDHYKEIISLTVDSSKAASKTRK